MVRRYSRHQRAYPSHLFCRYGGRNHNVYARVFLHPGLGRLTGRRPG